MKRCYHICDRRQSIGVHGVRTPQILAVWCSPACRPTYVDTPRIFGHLFVNYIIVLYCSQNHYSIPECPKAHLKQSKISKFFRGGPPDPTLSEREGKEQKEEGRLPEWALAYLSLGHVPFDLRKDLA